MKLSPFRLPDHWIAATASAIASIVTASFLQSAGPLSPAADESLDCARRSLLSQFLASHYGLAVPFAVGIAVVAVGLTWYIDRSSIGEAATLRWSLHVVLFVYSL